MNDNNNLTKEDLQMLRELINNLDEKGEIFKLSSAMIDANEKFMEQEKNKSLNLKEGERKI